MKIILAGPPQTGKSCLRYGLKEALISLTGSCPYPLVITACPDGEGAWFHETAANNLENANRLKQEQKKGFDPQFTKHLKKEVAGCSSELTLIDIGGKMSEENTQICVGATHAIILAANEEDFSAWREFCEKLSVDVLAEIESDFHGSEDRLPTMNQNQILFGSIHYLQRGEMSLPERPTIQYLAKLIANHFTKS